jgi:hypothetical protein
MLTIFFPPHMDVLACIDWCAERGYSAWPLRALDNRGPAGTVLTIGIPVSAITK